MGWLYPKLKHWGSNSYSYIFQGIFCMFSDEKDIIKLTISSWRKWYYYHIEREWKRPIVGTKTIHTILFKWWSLFNIPCQNTDRGDVDKLRRLMKNYHMYNLLTKKLNFNWHDLLVPGAARLCPWCWTVCR